MTNLFINRDLKDEIISQSGHFPHNHYRFQTIGQTTLCKQMFPDYHYVNLKILQNRNYHKIPKHFRNSPAGLIVDEAQQYPDLFSYVQVVVDENPDS